MIVKANASFPGRYRLKKKRDFAEVQGKGARISSKFFLMLVSPSASGDSRLGLVITKKIDKRAVYRNRLKRRLREAFRRLRPDFRQSRDLVIIARRDSLNLTFAEIQSEFAELCRRAKILAP